MQSCPERNISEIWALQITKFSVKKVNRATITNTPWWYKRVTQWLQSYPCKTKTSQVTSKKPMKFMEPSRKPKVICTDNSLEFGRSREELSCNHCTSTPHRSETNGIAERAVRRVNEVTSAVLLQSGLDKEWWADYMECCCYLRNNQDLLSDGKTPYERRFRVPFNGPIIPFGAMVEYHRNFCKRPIEITSIWSQSLAKYFSAMHCTRGESGNATY